MHHCTPVLKPDEIRAQNDPILSRSEVLQRLKSLHSSLPSSSAANSISSSKIRGATSSSSQGCAVLPSRNRTNRIECYGRSPVIHGKRVAVTSISKLDQCLETNVNSVGERRGAQIPRRTVAHFLKRLGVVWFISVMVCVLNAAPSVWNES